MNSLEVFMDYSWLVQRYLWIVHGKIVKLRVFCAVASDGFPNRRGDSISLRFKNLTKKETHKHENDARRKIIAIRLINSSSTSVSVPIMKKHIVGKSMDICG